MFYYVGVNDPVWKLSIRTLLLSRTMLEYLDRISENMTVQDPKGNLNYLKVEAAASEAAQQESAQEGDAAESSPEAASDSATDTAGEDAAGDVG